MTTSPSNSLLTYTIQIIQCLQQLKKRRRKTIAKHQRGELVTTYKNSFFRIKCSLWLSVCSWVFLNQPVKSKRRLRRTIERESRVPQASPRSSKSELISSEQLLLCGLAPLQVSTVGPPTATWEWEDLSQGLAQKYKNSFLVCIMIIHTTLNNIPSNPGIQVGKPCCTTALINMLFIIVFTFTNNMHVNYWLF